jgi:hypothetical protein
MQLFRNAKFCPISYRHFFRFRRVGIPQAFLEVVRFNLDWNFDLGCYSSTNIWTEISGIPDDETMGRLDLDLKLFSVNLSHPFDLPKHYSIPVIQTVFLVIKQNCSFLFLGNTDKVYCLNFFACGI